MAIFGELYQLGEFVMNINSTFICLIPRKKGAKCISDLKPISFVGTIYKIISKVLAKHLKSVLSPL